MSFDNLENFYIGQQVTDNSGNYWGECVSYVKRYAQEVLSIPNADSVLYVVDDLAKNMYLKPNPPSLQYFDLIPSNPQRGDIVVYGNPNDNSYGDVAVALGGGNVIGQLGFPVYHPVAIRAIGSPLGFLRLKGDNETMLDAPHQATLYVAYLGRLPTPDEVNRDVGKITTETMINNLDSSSEYADKKKRDQAAYDALNGFDQITAYVPKKS